ncbi:2'-5' RNA ligase family protein [Streptomyces sp. A3M-1-3]|uniref:2'-5' RNA ligase family protein n=1 Tax=Streptomyces sp. A3M-1-3 TaxID=2962044 RepID=UPI0020B85626|nr:2'-5' RNA ligase family protein [Streptomyces sp. A3M-1-3]MCP3820552.1 2'-5' RNA ligase family protein [Streptomyces sp. A3M-1-3]
MSNQPEKMADHWWWRPGWSVSRRFYTWHLTFHDQPDVQRLVGAYRDSLVGIPGFDLIPDQWLHLTMQGIGFVDEVDEKDITAIVEAARTRLAAIPEFEVRFAAPTVTPEAVETFAVPAEPVATVRDAIRSAIGDVLPEVPERAEGFRPHLSVAYSSSEGPATPIHKALAAVDTPPATARIRSAELIVLHRDNQMYEWTPFARVPLG